MSLELNGIQLQNILDLLEQANQIAGHAQISNLLSDMLALCMEISGAEKSLCYLLNVKNRFTVAAQEGFPQEINLLGEKIGTDYSAANQCIHSRHVVKQNAGEWNIYKDHEPRHLRNEKVHCTIAFPLIIEKKAIGAIQLFNTSSLNPEICEVVIRRLTPDIFKLMLLDSTAHHSDRLQVLLDIIGRLGESLDQEQLLRMMIENASYLLNAEASSLFLLDESTGELVLKISSAKGIHAGENLRVPAGEGIIGYVVKTGETVRVSDTKKDQRHYIALDQATDFPCRSIIAVPLRTRAIQLGRERGKATEQIIGGIEAVNKREGHFDENDGTMLEAFAGQAATILYIARLYEEANELFLGAIEALTAAIDAKDPYTQGHSHRVSEYSVRIARELGLSSELIHQIRVGSILHDVGKIGIPDHVLKKPGSLTSEEFEIIKSHTTIGQKIMGQVRMLKPELSAIIEHHERLDGSGYPLGLAGDQISIIGRIVAVADAFDAMTSNRPYRAALNVNEALQRLKLCSGNDFDPGCVNALIRLFT